MGLFNNSGETKEEKNGFGKLKSSAGWVYLKKVERVQQNGGIATDLPPTEKCKIQKQKDLKIELLHKHRFLSIIEDVQGGVRLNYQTYRYTVHVESAVKLVRENQRIETRVK